MKCTQKKCLREYLSTMLESLVGLLEKKGVLTQAEWEKEIKGKVKIE